MGNFRIIDVEKNLARMSGQSVTEQYLLDLSKLDSDYIDQLEQLRIEYRNQREAIQKRHGFWAYKVKEEE